METGDLATQGNALGKYRLVAELGRGGMAHVFLAVVQGPGGFNKLVVVKEIQAQLVDDPEFFAMFLEEARLSARLNHPNVIHTNEVGQEGRRHFIAMEYLDGQPLNRINSQLQQDGGLPREMSLRVVADALRGLHYAHELVDYDGTPLRLVHRDVSPHNVFVTYDGQVKVVDFGIAKAQNSTIETVTGALKGKVPYMAPEQALSKRVDRRADVFAVGIMLWEIAAGRRRYRGVQDVAIVHKLIEKEHVSPRTVNADVAPRLEAIVMKATSPDPEARHATAEELALEVEEFLEESGHGRVTARDVGKLVADKFAAERRRIQLLIEQQVTHGGAIALVSLHPGAADKSRSHPSQAQDATRRLAPSSVAGQDVTALTASVKSVPGELVPAPPPPRTRLWIAAAGLGALGAVGILFGLTRDGSRSPAPAASAASSAAAPAATFTLTVESTPAGAHVVEDGKDLGATPLAVQMQAGATRRFVLTLDGYAPYLLAPAPLKADAMVSVALVAQPAAESAPSSAPTAVPTGRRGGGARPHPPPSSTPLDIKMKR